MDGVGNEKQYERWLAATLKFDYFMAGLAAALASFQAKDMHPVAPLGWPEVLEIIAFLCFAGAVFTGFRRIEAGVHILRLPLASAEYRQDKADFKEALDSNTPVYDAESGQPMSRERITALLENRLEMNTVADGLAEKIARRAEWNYAARNMLIVSGFLFLAIGRIWGGFVNC